MALILSGTDGLSDVDGSASTPAIRGTDTNTGIFFPAADTIAFAEGGAEVARFDSSGNLGIGTSSPTNKLEVNGIVKLTPVTYSSTPSSSYGGFLQGVNDGSLHVDSYNPTGNSFLAFGTNASSAAIVERMRITSGGQLLTGASSWAGSEVGLFQGAGKAGIAVNRTADDGGLVRFFQDGTQEGDITVSGTTVSYNGGHLARWSQLLDGSKDESILKGTVLSNLDEMCVWEKEGVVAENEQLNKMKVSDVEGDTNVAGVFVNWTIDDAYGVDDMNIAMTGDMIIRIAQGVTVQRGDLLMSAGDGTAKPQGDDIVRSKTVAKVTSTHVTCTYADGSYCVPCVLMAC